MRVPALLLAVLVALLAGWWVLREPPRGAGPAHRLPVVPGAAARPEHAELEAAGEEARRELPGEEPAAFHRPGVHGRVVDGRGAGVLGTHVLLVPAPGAEARAETRSGADGTFRLGPAVEPAWLEVRPGAVFVQDLAPRRLDPEERRGERPVVVELRRALRGRVRGRVVDRSGRPVPFLHFWMQDSAGTDEGLVSDAAGRFETTQRFREGALALVSREARGLPGRLVAGPVPDGEWPFEDLTAVFATGPTVELCLSGPGAGSTDLRARLTGLGHPGGGLDLGRGAPVRGEGGRAWARFEELRGVPGPPFRIWVGEPGSRLLGSAPVAADALAGGPCVALRLEERCELRARALDPEGRSLDHVEFELLGADGRPLARAEGPPAESDEDGWAVLPGLAPGPARLRASLAGWNPIERDLELPCAPVQVELEPRADLGVVEGVLVLPEGVEPPVRAFVALVPVGDPVPQALRRPPFLRECAAAEGGDGPARLPFRVERVPPGQYRLAVSSSSDLPLVPSPLLHLVRAPASGLEVSLTEPRPRRATLVLEGPDGRPHLGEVTIELRREDGSRRFLRDGSAPAEDGTRTLDLRLDGERGWWTVVARGHRPAGGEFAPGSSATLDPVRAVLHPGWGCIVDVTDARTRQPLSGITLLADGEPVLVSPAAGPAVLSLAARPGTLAVAPGPWGPAPGSALDPSSGAFVEPDPVLRVVLVPGD